MTKLQIKKELCFQLNCLKYNDDLYFMDLFKTNEIANTINADFNIMFNTKNIVSINAFNHEIKLVDNMYEINFILYIEFKNDNCISQSILYKHFAILDIDELRKLN